MDFSYGIVIVTYNRLELLKECLAHALNQTLPAKKIIVINNFSSDGTTEYLNSNFANNENVIIFNEDDNIGGAGGFSHGVRLAMKENLDWIMLIDDDAILDYTCMEKMDPRKTTIKAEAYACAVYCNGNIDISHRRNLNVSIDESNYCSEFPCELATFCGIMLHKSLVQKIGYPLSEYFIWFDDTEYSIRINKYSKIITIPNAKLVHKVKSVKTETSKPIITWKSYYGTRNSLYTYKKHHLYNKLIISLRRLIKQELICAFKSIFNRDLVYERNLRFDAIHDGLCGRLGKNTKYLPNSK